MVTLPKITNKIFIIWLITLLLIGSIRVIDSYAKLTIAPDEQGQVVTGIEWLENGTYYLEALHPPLARISVALLPYLSGMRLGEDFYKQVKPINTREEYERAFKIRDAGCKKIFFGQGYEHYKKVLFLSRLGTLPYFIIGGLVLVIWVRRVFNEYIALLSLFFYTTLPIILAQAGLATTDMAMSSLVVCAIIAFANWLLLCSWKNTILLGISFGLLLLTKFSGAIFFLLLLAPIILVKDFLTREISKGFVGKRIQTSLVGTLIVFLIIWAGYRFALTNLTYPYFLSHAAILTLKEILQGFGFNQGQITAIFETKILPFPEFFHGLSDLIDRSALPYAGYILGKVLFYHGVWYFFLVASIFKMPLPFLFFSGCGFYLMTRKDRQWESLLPVVVTFMLFLVSTGFNINIGLRHLLPVFPFMGVIAAVAVYHFAIKQGIITRAIVLGLMLIYIIPTVMVHPNYISYFNVLAGSTPEDILIDGDFDIGQELELAQSYPKIQDNLDNTKLYYKDLSYPKFFGFKHAVMGFDGIAKNSKFQITYSKEKYLLITLSLLKILPPEKQRAIENCAIKERIGLTFMLYDLKSCHQ